MVLCKNVICALIMRFFCKGQKTLDVGKIRKYNEERVFFGKKTFSSFEKPSLQKWRETQNMPLVAGRLVIIPLDYLALFSLIHFFLAFLLSFSYVCRINYEEFNFNFLIKKSLIYIFPKNTFSRRRSRCFRFPSVVNRCIFSEVHRFSRQQGRP